MEKYCLKHWSWLNSVTTIMDGQSITMKIFYKVIMHKTLRPARIWKKYWSKISIILWCQIVFIFYHFSCFVFKFATLWTEKVTTLHSKIKRKHVGPMQIWFYFSKAIYYSINHQRQTFCILTKLLSWKPKRCVSYLHLLYWQIVYLVSSQLERIDIISPNFNMISK